MEVGEYWKKNVLLPSKQGDCFAHITQDFLICTTVHKARELGIYQGEVVVHVTLDKTSRQTKPYTHSENPYFNEYFVFEMRTTLLELLRLTILYEVRKHNQCKKSPSFGELFVDMQSVWNQPNRCYFKKWGRLEIPIGNELNINKKTTHHGYLQIDLAIVSQASNPHTVLRPLEEDIMSMNKWQIHNDYDDIEKNLLQTVDKDVLCNIRYSVKFYRGCMMKKADYIIQVSYAGCHFRFHPFKGKTAATKGTQQPIWNKEVTFTWMYPALAHTFLIQLFTNDPLQWKCLAEYELHFDEIAFNGKPAFGPTFIHLYDSINTYQYLGRILLEINSECLTDQPVKEIKVRDVSALEESRFWLEEYFLIEFLPFQGEFIRCNSNNCKIVIKFAEHQSNYFECNLKSYTVKQPKPTSQSFSNTLKYFRHNMPFKSITLRALLPDNRSKYDIDNFLYEILSFCEYEVDAFKLFQIQSAYQYYSQVKVLRAIVVSILRRIQDASDNKIFEQNSFGKRTTWDYNRLMYLKEFFETKLRGELKNIRNRLKVSKDVSIDIIIEEVVHNLRDITYKLRNLMTIARVQDELPNLLLILMVGSKEIAICRLDSKRFLKPPTNRTISAYNHCWKRRNFIFKDIQCQHTCVQCGCMVGVFQGCLSIVAESERTEFFSHLIGEWKHPEPFYWCPNIQYSIVKGRIFLHQGKIRPGSDKTGLCDPYVRVTVCSYAAETNIVFASLSPIWNSVISFEKIVLAGPLHWYINNPPLIFVEVYDTDKRTADDYLGCGYLPVSVISNDWIDSNAMVDSDVESSFPLNDLEKFFQNTSSLQKFKYMRLMSPPPLKWVPISQNGGTRAEILMSGELVEQRNPNETPDTKESVLITIGIPTPIRPIMKNYALEVVFAGFRNYNKGGSSLSVRHRVKVMMGDLLLTSGLSMTRIKNSINFLIVYASGVVILPEQLEYWPAVMATDVAVTNNGVETTLGAVTISDSKRFLQRGKRMNCSEPIEPYDNTSNAESNDNEQTEVTPLINRKRQNIPRWKRLIGLGYLNTSIEQTPDDYGVDNALDESNYNWWTKYYNSNFLGRSPGGANNALSSYKHRLRIYQHELEKEAEFSYLNDWAEPFLIVHGVKFKKNAMPKEESYATLKLNIKITCCEAGSLQGGGGAGGDGGGDADTLKPLPTILNPKYHTQLQSLAELVKIVVRVYIVQGVQLRPCTKSTQADAYVKVQFGTKQLEHILEVSLFNRCGKRDDAIGSTFIDLEDRWRSKHRATCGLAYEYSSYGYNKWREYAKPSEILKELCLKSNVKLPRIRKNNTIEIDGVSLEDETKISLKENLEERLSLTVLHNLDKLPSFGYKLVPEHVETRSLYRNDYPGIEQGKVQLWIEVYDGNLNIPAPLDLTPDPPKVYQLRVIVYQCSDVFLQESNIFGKAMSDIYFKGWCSNPDEYQLTDTHFRSLNGEGQFNWRMVFPFRYSIVEDMMVVRRRAGLLDAYEIKQPPKLFIQVFDKDIISADDFIGSLEIQLSNIREPAGTAKACTLTPAYSKASKSSSSTQRKLLNLFRERKVRGWFPLKGRIGESNAELTGKVDLELEILTELEAASYPVGLGREPPQSLPLPARPDTSFNPFTNPLKGLRKIVLPELLKYLAIIAVCALVIFGLVLFIYTIPERIIGTE